MPTRVVRRGMAPGMRSHKAHTCLLEELSRYNEVLLNGARKP